MFATLDGIQKSYGGSAALRGVGLGLREGEITAILGPSGCGKTTLLRILAGLVEPDEGSVSIGGRVVNDPRSRVPVERRQIGMVFQDALLWPHLTVRGNIAFPLGRGKGRDPKVLEAAKAAEIDAFLDRYPAQLSGGERRRASIARAIVGEPRLLLMDEPLSGLDANLRVRLLGTIRGIQKRLSVTTCYVTHDQEEALGVADRVVVMRDGKILQEGTPEEVYRNPKTSFVAGFVGLSSLIPGERVDGHLTTPLGTFDVADSGPSVGGGESPALLAVRPESVHLNGSDGIPGRVLHSVFRGDRWLVTVAVREREVLLFSPVRREAGEEVHLSLDPPPVAVIADEVRE